MFLSKKGVSPLIATVLLISFAVALGAVVMNWAGSLSGSGSCNDIHIDIVSICYDEGKQQVMASIQNGEHAIPGVRFYILGSLEAADIEIKKVMTAEAKKDFSVVYSTSEYGTIDEVSVWPLTGSENEISVCEDEKKLIKIINPC
jgi:flagellin-like protein